MAITVINSASAGDAGGSTCTTAPISTLGANLLVAFTVSGTPAAVTDNQGNVYTSTVEDTFSGLRTRQWYIVGGPTSVAHTFTATGTNVSLCVIAFNYLNIGAFMSKNFNTNATGPVTNSIPGLPFSAFRLLIHGFGSGVANPSVPVLTKLGAAAGSPTQVTGIVGDGVHNNAALGYWLQGPDPADFPIVRWTYATSAPGCGMTLGFSFQGLSKKTGWIPMGTGVYMGAI